MAGGPSHLAHGDLFPSPRRYAAAAGSAAGGLVDGRAPLVLIQPPNAARIKRGSVSRAIAQEGLASLVDVFGGADARGSSLTAAMPSPRLHASATPILGMASAMHIGHPAGRS